MKKILLTISIAFLMLLGMLSISASAERYTEFPVTVYQSLNGYESKFLLKDLEIYVYPNEEPKYTNSAEIYVYGDFMQGNSVTLNFDCYDANGNYIESIIKILDVSDVINVENSNFYSFYFDIPDVTASVEIGTVYPAAWTNTYYHCKYINVYSDDGRIMGIQDLLLPVYENCGWHATEWMYSLDGRAIEVPYCDVEAYKAVGWYLWPDYHYITFFDEQQEYLQNGDYVSAFNNLEYILNDLEGTYYEQSLYDYKTQLMDTWRARINSPLAYCSSYVYDGDVTITFRNVSYKTIKAFKLQFDCYNVFNEYLSSSYKNYIVEDAWIYPSESAYYTWGSIPYKTDHIGNVRVTQVVYSDGTSWYI